MLVGALAGLPAAAPAQTEVELNQLNPAPDLGASYFSTLTGRTLEAQHFRLALLYSFARNPLVVTRPESLTPGYQPVVGNVVTSQHILHLTAAYGIVDWLEIGLDLPLVLAQGGEPLTGLESPSAVDASFGLGDLRLVPKLRLFDHRPEGGFGGSVAILLDAALPTGQASALQGGPLRLEPRLAAEVVFPWDIRLAGNVGYAWRESEGPLLDTEVRSRVTWSGAVEVPVLRELGPVDRVGLVAEVFSRLSLETLVGAKVDLFGFTGLAGFGAGLEDATFTPSWRVFAAIGYGGGFGGDDEAKDATKAAEDAEAARAVADADGDGIADAFDACPEAPEDLDGFEDGDGCPDLDDDGDGITDAYDKCPTAKEDRDGFEDGDGCPDLDDDKDGVADVDDRCPRDPEDLDGVDDDDGCPDVEMAEIPVVVNFDTDSAELPPGADYELDRVATMLASSPRWAHYWVEGHADESGSPEHNLKLSEARANAVRNYLLARGVDPGKLTVVGLGQRLGVRDNASETGRFTNRRVEFRAGLRSAPPAPADGEDQK